MHDPRPKSSTLLWGGHSQDPLPPPPSNLLVSSVGYFSQYFRLSQQQELLFAGWTVWVWAPILAVDSLLSAVKFRLKGRATVQEVQEAKLMKN